MYSKVIVFVCVASIASAGQVYHTAGYGDRTHPTAISHQKINIYTSAPHVTRTYSAPVAYQAAPQITRTYSAPIAYQAAPVAYAAPAVAAAPHHYISRPALSSQSFNLHSYHPTPIVSKTYTPVVATYPAPAIRTYSTPSVASYSAPAVATYSASTYSAPAVANYPAPAITTYSTPSVATYSAPAVATYSAPVYSARTYSAPAVATYSAPAVSYTSQVDYAPATHTGYHSYDSRHSAAPAVSQVSFSSHDVNYNF